MTSTTELKPDILQAINFLQQIHGKNPFHICSIHPNAGITNKTFFETDLTQLQRFLASKLPNENLYFQVNQLKPNCRNKKATKKDIEHCILVHVDIDDLGGLERLRSFELKPTATVYTGNGYHGYWLLDEATDNFDRVEEINNWLVERLDGDPSVTDISRILRLPGTNNLPNAKKIAAGKNASVACLVSELTNWQNRYSLEDFGKPTNVKNANKPKQNKKLPDNISHHEIPESLSARMREVALTGDDPSNPRNSSKAKYKSRSEAVFAVAVACAAAGLLEAQIAGILINPKYLISQSVLEKNNPSIYALRQAEKACLQIGDRWPNGCRGETKEPRTTLQNTKAALLRSGVNFWFDEFRQKNFAEGILIQKFHGELSDRISLFLRDWITKEFGFDPKGQLMADAIGQLCSENAFDPVAEYLSNLKWDGKERIRTWLIDYASAEDNEYVKAVSSILLIAAVRRVRSPGTKFDTIPVLEGMQGSGKSTLIQIMASEEYFSDQDILAADTKTQMEALEGVWLFELCELAGMKHADVNKVKAFASRSVDRARPAYGRYLEKRSRRGVLIGTTNDDCYLKDETGNRRFWPIRTGDIDLKSLASVRDQLWAEAAHKEAKNYSIFLPRDLWEKAAEEQAKRVEEDGWETILENLKAEIIFHGRELAPSKWILEEQLLISAGMCKQHHWKRLAKTMRNLGWQGPEALTMPSGKKTKGYWRKTDKEDFDLNQLI